MKIRFFVYSLVLFVGWAQAATKPNVLFIAIDDLRIELGCYGAQHIQSPHIDRLAASGVRFTRAYVQQAICMASRASIMSGLRPERCGIYTGESIDKLVPNVLTLNQCFAQHGYTVAACGKIYHFDSDREKQFGAAYMKPKQTWTGRGYVTPEAIEKIKLNTEFKRGPAYECADVEDARYKDGANTKLALRKLEELSRADQPFFLAVGFSKPHLPFVAPKKYWDMYPPSKVTLPTLKTMPKNANQYTMRLRGELNSYYGIPQTYAAIDEDTTRILRRAYYACVSYVDAQVGKLLDQLDRLGLRENTIVVLWGDHGFKLGDYTNWCKWSNMEIDTNIPFIFSIPKGLRNAVCHTPVEALDLYPTLVELCGLSKPDHLEGVSLVHDLVSPHTERQNYVYTLWPHSRTKYAQTVMGYSIKDTRYNYVEWVKLNSGEVLAKELYDHLDDPRETINVVDDSRYEDVILQMAQKLEQRKKGTDHSHALNLTR